jgi:hypothetical protein
MTFLTARTLSNVTVRITSVNDDGEVTFEAIDAAMAGGSAPESAATATRLWGGDAHEM